MGTKVGILGAEKPDPPNVLLIGENTKHTELIERALTIQRLICVTVATVADAISVLKKVQPNLIIIEIYDDPERIIKRLRTVYNGGVIGIGNFQIGQLKQYGYAEHLSLPINIRILLELIRSFLPDMKILNPTTVLYIEDNPTNLALVERVLSMHRLTCISYNDLDSAVEYLATDSPGLVLCDLEFDGRQLDPASVIKRLRTVYRGPIIAVTAYAKFSDRQYVIDAGFTDYLPKPLPIKELIDMFGRFFPEKKRNL